MKFSCHVQALLSGMSIVTRVLSLKAAQPILEGVLVKACDDGVQLTCSDGAISVLTTISADVSENGSVVLPGKLLLDVVRKMPQEIIKVSVNENCAARLNCLGARMTLAGQSGALYPALPLVSAENSLMLPQLLLREMIQQTSFAIAQDDQRAVLNGCLFDVEGGEARMVALDGFQLATRLARVSADSPSVRAIIPGKAVSEIARVLDDDESKMAMILTGGNQLMLNLESTQLYSTLIEGEYINYRQILPTSWHTRVKFDRDQLSMCVERCALIAREGRNNLIKLIIEPNRMILTSKSESGEAYEELDVQTEGEDMTIAFNVMYVSDILRVLPEGNHYLRFNSPVSPCVVCPETGDDFLYLMLPVRVTA